MYIWLFYLWLRDLYFVTKRLQLHTNVSLYETYTIAGVLSRFIPEWKAGPFCSIFQSLHMLISISLTEIRHTSFLGGNNLIVTEKQRIPPA
jgi:hypothetical protein